MALFSILLLLVVGSTLSFFLIRTLVFFGTMLYGAPYVDTSERDVAKIVTLSAVKRGERIIDLGSGDGRLVIALARAGARASGIEVNPFLVKKSRALIVRASRAKRFAFQPSIVQGSLWDHDLSSYDVVIFYGTTYILPSLATKLQRELKRNARVISNYFALPGWRQTRAIGTIRHYQVPRSYE